MREDPVLVLFCGGMGGSDVEDLLAGALRASALDLLERSLAGGAYDGAIVVADEASAAAFRDQLPAGVVLDVDVEGEGFHFGRRLSDVVRRFELVRPLYTGCGLPLLKGDEMTAVALALRNADKRLVVANNYFSADLLGFTPGSVVDEVEFPDNDRILPRLLTTEAGFTNYPLPRTIANQFDLDSTGDLAVLSCAGGAGPRLQAYMEAMPLDTSRLVTAARLFTDKTAEVLVAGRVGSQVWQYLEAETACRIRMYSEERGMLAAGRDTSGDARSLLAFHLQAVGPRRFFAELSEMVHAAFIDTRPILAHLGLQPSRPDRFRSDAMTPAGISDPWLREFTEAAIEAPIPVVLGGSSLVTSGVQLLSEAAWRENDQRAESQYRPMGRAKG
jgi:hypothetical protein